MKMDDFLLLNTEQKKSFLIFSGDLPGMQPDPDNYFKLYFFKKFYFEEIVNRKSDTVIETNQVQKFAHFKKYLLAIRGEKLSN